MAEEEARVAASRSRGGGGGRRAAAGALVIMLSSLVVLLVFPSMDGRGESGDQRSSTLQVQGRGLPVIEPLQDYSSGYKVNSG